MKSHTRSLLRSAFLITGLLTLLGTPGVARSASSDGRVIVLGFDGADATTVGELMAAGQLPNLAKLAEQGTFAPLRSTNPAESAAGWAALNTGISPAKNGVPSFLVRNLVSVGPVPAAGHIVPGTTKKIETFDHTGVMKWLVETDPMMLGGGVGGVVFIAFFIVFAVLLRVKKGIALFLAASLAGAGVWGVDHAGSYVPSEIPGVYENKVTAEGFWAVAARAGVESVVLDAALAFDQPTVPGARVLGGLGLPDVRPALNGEWFIYTTDDLELSRAPEGDASSSGSGFTFRVDERDGKVQTDLYGPVNFWERDKLVRAAAELEEQLEDKDLGWKESRELREKQKAFKDDLKDFDRNDHDHRTSTPLVMERVGDKIRVTIGGRSEDLAEGDWSDWYHPEFQINPLIRVSSVTRVRLVSANDPLELYVNSLEIDPANPPFWQPISQPNSFSADLVEWIGSPFETLGWACMTNQMKDEKLDIDAFLEDIEFTMGWREKMTMATLGRDDWSILFSVFSTTDRVQHIMYKYYDDKHPMHDPVESAREVPFFGQQVALKEIIPAIYRQADRIVGRVMDEGLKPDDTLMLCADHGFTSYRRGLNVNNWLAEKGYLFLKPGVKKSDGGVVYAYPDWSKTQAYSLGLGMLFLNLEGREPGGIVKLEEATELLERIRADFLAEVDSQTGEHVGYDAIIMKDLYDGPWGTAEYECADLMLGFARNYRTSWSTVFGKIKLQEEGGKIVLGDLYSDNKNNWSGDHASNSPDVVTGIFFCNRPVELPADGVSVMHLAPTVLDLMGVDIPADYEMPALTLK
ncbi:MAG: putative AlkP superfamily phosphohydrolase/phosphomutase [Chlamydiales bacterium]|jgi:predicted AlkP superfamily phosphohydrolase/phosphomutase